ncbi:MAG: hypothetical protein ACP5T2_00170 [Thermoprotei archaeon]
MSVKERPKRETHRVQLIPWFDMPIFDLFFISVSPLQLLLISIITYGAYELRQPIVLSAWFPALWIKYYELKGAIDSRKKVKKKKQKVEPPRPVKIVGVLSSSDGKAQPYTPFSVYEEGQKIGGGITDKRGKYAFYYFPSEGKKEVVVTSHLDIDEVTVTR